MTDDARWMTLKEAVDFGTDFEILPKHAGTKLLEALKSETIRSRATWISRRTKEIKWEDSGGILHGLDWKRAHSEDGSVSFFESSLSYVIKNPNVLPPDDVEVWHAKGIELFKSHVEKIWPDFLLKKELSSIVQSKGGRKMKYDWPGAAGFTASYIVENDYPITQSELVRVLEDWFKQKGNPPSVREIERFVSEVYQYRPGKP